MKDNLLHYVIVFQLIVVIVLLTKIVQLLTR